MGTGMGGIKGSGLGRRHGSEGILKYTESQNVTAARVSPIMPLPGVSPELNEALYVALFRLVKRVPGLR
jgi:succinate-semialdehyde dehydrogenase/glutarate-semialdehyde dehydrogenase